MPMTAVGLSRSHMQCVFPRAGQTRGLAAAGFTAGHLLDSPPSG